MSVCRQFAAAVTAGLLGSCVASGAWAIDAASVVKNSDTAMKAHTEKISYRMTLVGADGAVEQVRTFETYFKRDGAVEQTLQKFQTPPALSGTGLLIVDDSKPDNSIWLYLPTTRRIRRVSGHDKRDRYMGTEFSYEDFQGYRIPYYAFSMVGERQDADGRDCYVVDAVANTPSETASTGYSRKRYWIDKKSLYPVKVEFYGLDKSLEKVFVVHGLRQVGHYWRPKDEEMTNLQSKRITKLELQSDDVDQPLDDLYVSQRFLRGD